jgi:hypothetical protein
MVVAAFPIGAAVLADMSSPGPWPLAPGPCLLGGVVGLGALTAAVDRTGGFGSAGTWLMFGVAWLLAIALFWGPHKSGTA